MTKKIEEMDITENNMQDTINEVSTQHEKQSIASEFANANNEVFTSIINDGSIESKSKVFNAMGDTDYALGDKLNETINMVDFLVHSVTMEDDRTGELVNASRCVIIDDKGKSYGTVSTGVKSSILKIFQTFGNPNTWTNPLPIQAFEKKGRKGYKFIAIKVVI